MQYYYGNQNILRALDEAAFWKHQEAEHTEVIQAITPGLEEKYVLSLKEWGLRFTKACGDAAGYIETVIRSNGDYERFAREMTEFIRHCLMQSQEFVSLLEMMLRSSAAVGKSDTAQTVINHIARESKYFIGIDRLMLR